MSLHKVARAGLAWVVLSCAGSAWGAELPSPLIPEAWVQSLRQMDALCQEKSAVEAKVSLPACRADLRIRLARRLFVDGMPEDRNGVVFFISDAIRVAPHLGEPWLEGARLTLQQIHRQMRDPQDFQMVVEYAQKARDLSPQRPAADYLFANILLTSGRIHEGRNLFFLTRSKFPDHPDTLVANVQFLAEQSPDEALESAVEALRKGASMDELSAQIAGCIMRLHPGTEGAQALEDFAEVWPDRWLWHRAAIVWLENHKNDRAEKAFQRAILAGNDIESRLQLGVLQYSLLHKERESVGTLKGLLEALWRRSEVRSGALALTHAHLAVAEIRSGHFGEALLNAHQALSWAGNDSRIVGALVEEFGKLHQEKALLGELKKAAEKWPLVEVLHMHIASIAMGVKDYALAREYFSNAIALSPDRDELLSSRALASYNVGAYASALDDFDAALRLKPQQGSYLYNRACMLSRLGRYEDALDSLRDAMALEGRFGEDAKEDPDFGPLRADAKMATKWKTLMDTLAQAGSTQVAATTESPEDDVAPPVLSRHTTEDP